MRIAIVGGGRMGRAIQTLAGERGHTIHTVVGSCENAGGRALTRERLAGADVALEFTEPSAAPGNIAALLDAGIPVVTGTTGWDSELPRLAALARERGGALLHAANFSVGVQLFLHGARELARRFASQTDFDAFILDQHHAAKQDAPSGTGLALQRAMRAEDSGRDYPITSVRAGSIPGTHSVTFDGPFESVSLTHTARDRRVFAAGALAAAEWLPGRRGVFTFDEMLFGRNR
jgi:4-hydroxy-tetrahydrodipicolinate reductase